MSIGKLFAATALAATGVLGAGIAQAHEAQVSWSVTIGAPVYSVPAPVVVRPAPVYAPAPVYYPAPAYYYGPPRPYYAPPVVSIGVGTGWGRRHGYRHW